MPRIDPSPSTQESQHEQSYPSLSGTLKRLFEASGTSGTSQRPFPFLPGHPIWSLLKKHPWTLYNLDGATTFLRQEKVWLST